MNFAFRISPAGKATPFLSRPGIHFNAIPAGRKKLMGSALIGLVVAILILSVLAAAIVPMISSSSQQTAAANSASKAYLLAESGFRIAGTKYLHSGPLESDKNNALENIEGSYTLSDPNSRFELHLFSYFYVIENDIPVNPNDTTATFTAHTPGTYPSSDILPTSGLPLQIGNQIYTLTSSTGLLPGQDDRLDMGIASTSPIPFYPAGTMAFPVAEADRSQPQTISNGDSLNYEVNHGNLFPRRNGHISVNGRLLAYAFNDRDNNRFVNVRDPNDNTMTGFAVPAGTPMVMSKFVRLESTGIYGSGLSQARRTVTFHTPLPFSQTTVRSEELADRFDNRSDWADTAGTTTSIDNVGEDSALMVDAAASSGSDQGSLTTFAPSTQDAVDIDFNASSEGNGNFLNYDLQVKVGFENTPVPPSGFSPPTSSIPAYHAAGLNFRLADLPSSGATIFNVNTYGLSFLRGNDDLSLTGDGIPDGLVPLDDSQAIVLWQQTGNGSDRTWLAYKEMVDTVFEEDNEDPVNNQFSRVPDSSTNLWNIENSGGERGAYWHYGDSTTNSYSNSGYIDSTPISLPAGYPRVTLTFWGWHETEPQRPGFALNDFDIKQVIILDDDGYELLTYTIGNEPAPGVWYREEIDLTALANEGRSIIVRFRFDTVDDANNDYEGWYIDDVRIVGPWQVQNSTLSVILEEAMVVRFTEGYPQIREGDEIYGNSNNTKGTVTGPPLLTSGDWTSGDRAEGTLLLNQTSVVSSGPAFDDTVNELLLTYGGAGRAEVREFQDTRDRKANIIKVFFASENGFGTPNTDPTDANTRAYPRLGPSDALQWPPFIDAQGNWIIDGSSYTAVDDYFRLVQWDRINTAAVPGLTGIAFRTRNQGLISNAIIQSHEPDLQSPDFPNTVTGPEIGLHSLGEGAVNTYFDDFGIRLEISNTNTISAPLQQ